jgi:tRNA threonylcarbamoyl adenosine modification protein (Sua5/YciO/YrdC/YwlC family)
MDAVAALRAGRSVLLPTDGVYGLCSLVDEEASRALYELKGRDPRQPSAIIAANVEALLQLVPELDASMLLPGPYTNVVRNPARRFPWLAGDRTDTIAVRLPVLPASAQAVLVAVGAVAATSANDPGEPPAASLDEVPVRIRAGCGAEIDAGRLPGMPSTVVDFTGDEPVVLRQGAGELR